MSLQKNRDERQAQDRQSVRRTLAGEQQAFEELVLAYQQDIFNLTYRMLGNREEAEDAAQEAFLRAYAKLATYDQARSFKTWLMSIASNYCIDRLRRRRLRWLSLDEPLPPHPALVSSAPDPEEAMAANERGEMVQALLDELPPDYRAAIVLHYWYDMPYKEIAEVLGATPSAVKSRLFRARKSLAEKLRREQAAKKLTPAMEAGR